MYWRGILTSHRLTGGAFGENFTLEGLTEADVCIGDVFSVGAAVVQISQPRQPCWKLARRWQISSVGWAIRVDDWKPLDMFCWGRFWIRNRMKKKG